MTGPFVSPDWLAAHLSDPTVIAVDGSWYLPTQNRDPAAEFAAGHVPGAVRFDLDAMSDRNSPLPHMMPNAASFGAAVGAMGIGDDMTIVVYDGAGLFSAPRVWWMFRAFGARDVRILDGGFPAWVARSHPVETGEARSRPVATFNAQRTEGIVAGLEDVHAALASGSVQVVDARPGERFRGEAPEPRPGVVPGHMPGSLSLPFGEIVKDGKLKPANELRAAFDAAGVTLDQPMVTSCGSGVSAAIVALAAETLGAPPPRIYDGSWAEWGSRPDLPKATGKWGSRQ